MKNIGILVLWDFSIFCLSMFLIFYPKQTINYFKWHGDNNIEHFISFYFYCLVVLIVILPVFIW